MLDLQRDQFEHDERFHRDIARLDVHSRLNHMALHFCKYTGQLAAVCSTGDPQLRSRTITDSFIISLCSANTLGLNLADHIAPSLGSFPSLRDLGLYLSNKLCPSTKLDDTWLFTAHAIAAAKMARACEKIDHLEAFPFREVSQEAVITLCQIALMAAAAHNIELISGVEARRNQIRSRSLIALFKI
jgi:hypothetical protein